MKKPGAHFETNDTPFVTIIVLAIVVLFIVFIKPIYQFVGKVQSGALWEKHTNTKEVEKNKDLEDTYKLLTPEGADRTVCTKTVSDEGGDKRITVTLYHTASKVQSIAVDYKYSGMTDNYSNYMFVAQSQFKEKKQYNLSNQGYSIEYKLNGNTLTAREVYLLNKTTLKSTGSFSETEVVVGDLDQDIDSLTTLYIGDNFKCEGEIN